MARPAYEGVHAPSADTLEIVSVPYEMPVCTSDYQRKQKSSSVTQRKTEGVQSQATMSDEQRRKELEEVEKQQQDFGIEH